MIFFKQNNLNKFNVKRLKILLSGFVPSLVAIFLPRNKKRIILNSTHNECYNFNSKYLFEYLIAHFPDYEVKFVMNNETRRQQLNQQYGVDKQYFIETESLAGMFYALRAKAWVTSALETPVGGVFLKINRFVFMIGHGAYFRSAVFLENNLPLKKRLYYHLIKNNFSHYLVTSPTIAKIAGKMFDCKERQVVILGEPMNDRVFMPNIGLIKQHYGEAVLAEKNILYMPTWRQNSALKLFPFADMDYQQLDEFLEKNKINICLRLHPSFEENLDFYLNQSKRIKLLDTQVAEDVNEVIGFFDLVITDYSSGHIGFLLTHKPVMFLPYDFADYEHNMGFVVPYETATPGPKPNTLQAFMDETLKLLTDADYYLAERIRVSALFNQYSHNNSQMNAEFIIKEMA